MKKALSLILALVMCLSLCACGGNNETKEPIESVSSNELFNDTDNGAKAELNVGKGTTIYGKITNISSSSCAVALIYPKGSFVSLEMPIEQLAELNPNQFIAAEGIVTSYNSSNSQKYTITATSMLDLTEMDAYIKKTITDLHAFRVFIEFSGDTNAGMIHGSLHDVANISLINEYVHSRDDVFMLTDDAKLREYLIGSWVYSQSYGGLKTESCEYKEDGTYLWKYQSQSYTGKVYDKEQDGDWSVKNGDLTSFRGEDTYIYVLCDDVFLQMGQLHIRVDYE